MTHGSASDPALFSLPPLQVSLLVLAVLRVPVLDTRLALSRPLLLLDLDTGTVSVILPTTLCLPLLLLPLTLLPPRPVPAPPHSVWGLLTRESKSSVHTCARTVAPCVRMCIATPTSMQQIL
eukprot:2886485-Rhodomonas_salina.2